MLVNERLPLGEFKEKLKIRWGRFRIERRVWSCLDVVCGGCEEYEKKYEEEGGGRLVVNLEILVGRHDLSRDMDEIDRKGSNA